MRRRRTRRRLVHHKANKREPQFRCPTGYALSFADMHVANPFSLSTRQQESKWLDAAAMSFGRCDQRVVWDLAKSKEEKKAYARATRTDGLKEQETNGSTLRTLVHKLNVRAERKRMRKEHANNREREGESDPFLVFNGKRFSFRHDTICSGLVV